MRAVVEWVLWAMVAAAAFGIVIVVVGWVLLVVGIYVYATAEAIKNWLRR